MKAHRDHRSVQYAHDPPAYAPRIADAASRPAFYLLVQIDGDDDGWPGAELVERVAPADGQPLHEMFFASAPISAEAPERS